jgi:hypothetical protein
MTDLVVRLRAEDPECGLRHSLATEAADEIERLRVWLESGGGRYWEGRYRDEAARVDELEAALDDVWQYISRADWFYLKPETRAALGEKKND